MWDLVFEVIGVMAVVFLSLAGFIALSEEQKAKKVAKDVTQE